MKRSSLTLAGVMLVLLVLGIGSQAIDNIVLTTDGDTQAPVLLQHRTHSLDRGIPCVRCHHNMAKVGTPKCNSCHTLEGKEGELNLELAYHGICLGCHQEPPEGTRPPTECEDCHTKRAADKEEATPAPPKPPKAKK